MKGISFLRSKCLRLEALNESFHKGCQTYFSLDSVQKKYFIFVCSKRKMKKKKKERKRSLQLEEANEC